MHCVVRLQLPSAGIRAAVPGTTTPPCTHACCTHTEVFTGYVAPPVQMNMQAVSAARAERSTLHGQKVAVHPDGHSMHDLAVAPHGRLFATSSTVRHVALWHTGTGMHVRTLQGERGVHPVRAVAWSPDGSMLAAATQHRTTKVWDVDTGLIKHLLLSRSG